MAESNVLMKAAASTESTVVPGSENLKEIYPDIFYTNGYNRWDKNIIRAKNIKFAIMVDHILWENKENFNLNGDQEFDETAKGAFGFGSDVETLYVTFGHAGNMNKEVLSTCDQVARHLVQAKIASQSAIIVDFNNDAQRSVAIVAAYLIYHETQNFHKAVEILSKYNNKMKLHQFYTKILLCYEGIIRTNQMTQNSLKIIRNVKSDSKNIKKDYAPYDPYESQDHKERIAMVQHLNAGNPMETFVSESEQEKKDYDLQHPYEGGAGEWNNSIHTDLLYDNFNAEY